ncbi:hypothetical protein CFT12S02847_09245, partial [Campylobacter fetus subsp. testudinum]
KERARTKGRPVKAIEFTFMPEARQLVSPKADHAESISRATKKEIILDKHQKDKKLIEEQEQDTPKFNPLTGEQVEEFSPYVGRYMR